MFDPNYPIVDLKGAEYNPREISRKSLDILMESVRTIGVVKPIIVRDKTIVAGHQRVKALKALKVYSAPVYLLHKSVNDYDEVRFNQLHNGTDFDSGDEAAKLTCDLSGEQGFVTIGHQCLAANFRSKKAVIRSEISRLLLLYGNWGGCVAMQSGEIIHAAQYAMACSLCRIDIRVYVLSRQQECLAKGFLSRSYGEFSYKHLDRDTFIQTYAQMFRLRGNKKELKSPTYEKLIIPYIGKNNGKCLDFGCGQGDYVKRLRAEGYNILGVELFFRKGASSSFDLRKMNLMVDKLISSLKECRFDVVICDYVMNSVDSLQAESDVLNCLDFFCRPGGKIFFSGRRKEVIENLNRMSKDVTKKRFIEFLDKDGFTALYRKGSWFYQKYHTKDQVEGLAKSRGWQILKRIQTSTTWNVMAEKRQDTIDEKTMKDSLSREFNLPLDKTGKKFGRSGDIINVYDQIMLQ